MAKEVQILFVYDIQKTQEDILGPIVYFYPSWVSDEQKSALCGQIVGTIQCMKNIFAKPDVISLVYGKFVIIEHGRFLFVMGTDKNTPSTFLQRRAKSLYSLIEFFHKDFDSLQYDSASNSSSNKLHDVIHTYLKLLLISGKMFTQKPVSLLPKSSNDIFTQAIHILECCRSHSYILGGLISYRNRLITTQFSPALTQLLLLTETYRATYSEKLIKLPFELPQEVKLYEVFISNAEYSKLLKIFNENDIFQRLHTGITRKASGQVLQKDYRSVLFAMKREESLLFTSVPEEESVPKFENYPAATKKTRPRFLCLENSGSRSNIFKNLKQLVDHNNSTSSSQIIVCNTPLQEPKKILHFNPLSICHNGGLDGNNTESIEGDCSKKFSSQTLKINSRKYYKTIADPMFPVFNENGKQVSFSFYENDIKGKYFLQSKGINQNSINASPIKNNFIPSHNTNNIPNSIFYSGVRRSSTSFFNCVTKGTNALENNKKILLNKKFDFKHKKPTKTIEQPDKENAVQKCVLFQWNEHDIALTMLLKLESCEDRSVLTALCDICTNHLGKLENKMRYSIESQNSRETDTYKCVSLNSIISETFWNGTCEDWRELDYFTDEFYDSCVSEVLVRSNGMIFYGYHCGPNRVFYSEITNCTGGLPLPTDPMGILQVKAKRRLERDCDLILL